MPDPTGEATMPARFSGKAALVTGAAGGIGLAIARRLAREGGRVMLTDIDEKHLNAAVQLLADEGLSVAGVSADLVSPDERARLVPKTIERWGTLDVLVNNAADHGTRTSFLSLPAGEWERVFTANAGAAAALCRGAASHMAERRSGAIVNITSLQARLPVSSYAAYVSSKGAVLALTRALAVELSPLGIRVNALSPGVIGTEAFEHALSGGPAAQGTSAALLGRQGSPEEVAAAVAFLASDDASFITGVELLVDGGRSISRRPDPFEMTFGDQSSQTESPDGQHIVA